jgi:hypothetical protein
MPRTYLRITEITEQEGQIWTIESSLADALSRLGVSMPTPEPVPAPAPAPSPTPTPTAPGYHGLAYGDTQALQARYPSIDMAEDVADWKNGKWGNDWPGFVINQERRAQ